MLDWLAHRAQVSPHKIALIFGDQRWTYGELNGVVAQLCGQLTTVGVQAGQQVAVLMPNRPEYVYLTHALARLGATLAPLNIRLTSEELRWQVEQADCRWVICADETEAVAAALNVPMLNVGTLERLNVEMLWPSQPLDLEAVQGLIYTSGTTGRPKGAMLTYNNYLWSAIASAFRLGADPADRWLTCLPLYHVGGLSIIFRCCLYGTAVVLQQGFDPVAVSQALETQDITLVSLVPTMLHRLLESHPSSLANSRLRCLLIGGAALSPALLERCRALELPLALTYGLTEAASQVATALSAEVYRKPGSVGRPLMFSSVRIVDPHGPELPAGEIGEIVVRGPTVMRGYYRQPEATRQTLRSGELYTGDLGYLDDEGDLWVIQRRADLIVSGGENVYPAEVEQALREHPAVGDVCVVGLNDAEWGQRVAAAVVRRSQAQVTEADLIAFCRTRLAGYKQPRLIRFIDALPQTASGKVQREVVRQQLELGFKSAE
jgi:O-succinylbenzoic acid--CoA ligase